MAMLDLANRAIIAVTLLLSFCITNGLLTANGKRMSHDTQIGYLLAMVNGDVNQRIPQWALV